MGKTILISKSRIPEAGAWGRKKTHEAVEHALDEGEKTANMRIERINASQDYQLPADVDQQGTGYHSGLIKYPHFYGQFFEYGFYSVPPQPFMRPASRKMRSVFKKDMDGLFRGFRGV